MSMQAADKDAVADSLALVAERCADPTPLVYARLFAQSPDMEALFVRDSDGSVRGQMLYQVLETLLDLTGAGTYGANLIRCERVNHENLGVPPDVFASFFTTVMETFRALLGPDWTPAFDAAWSALLAWVQAVMNPVVEPGRP
jgi:hemoglobin-like flavoprotein